MHSYRAHICDLYTAAVTKAARVLIAYKECVRHDSACHEFPAALTELEKEFRELKTGTDALQHALPSDLKRNDSLGRHIWWGEHRISEGQPQLWGPDPYEILERDLPAVLKAFDAWYTAASKIDSNYAHRLRYFDSGAHINSTNREAWPIFKTRATQMFDLPDDLDGYKLVDRLFGDEQPAVSTLTAKERRGYRKLMKGLYTLYRNPVSHNDSDPNPAATDAVTTLIGICLARITPTEN